MFSVICTSCSSSWQSELDWRCPRCGGALGVKDIDPFEKSKIRFSDHSIWRYQHTFNFVKKGSVVSLGEGGTPLVELDHGLFGKLDYVMPTGSFKDRGSSVALSVAKDLAQRYGITKIVDESSGNGGASTAAYAARAGVQCEIFTPENIAGPKLRQIISYGARLTRVKGSREDVSAAAQAEGLRSYFASHIWNPFWKEGVRSLSYELCESMNWETPDLVFIPTSAGVLLLGVVEGFEHLRNSGIIGELPTIVAVQSEQVSPVYHAFYGLEYRPPDRITSVADALISTRPARLNEMTDKLKEISGECEIVDDEEIMQSAGELAKVGVYVEPSSATAHAAWKKRLNDGKVSREESSVIILTGSGLKAERELSGAV